MGQALNAASAMPAYTLSDRGTWLSFANKGPLVIAVEGDPKLLNRYDVIQLNREKHGKERLEERRGSPSGWLRQRASRRSAPMNPWRAALSPIGCSFKVKVSPEGPSGRFRS